MDSHAPSVHEIQGEKPLRSSDATEQSFRSTRPATTGKLLCSAAMTASIDTAPLRGQSLRGRPVHETCTPVNQGNQLLRDEGEAAAWPPPYPLVARKQCQRSTTPPHRGGTLHSSTPFPYPTLRTCPAEQPRSG